MLPPAGGELCSRLSSLSRDIAIALLRFVAAGKVHLHCPERYDGITTKPITWPLGAVVVLAILYGKISDHRAAEARDVTAQMQTDLQEGVKREAPKIQETLELLRRRFDDNIKSKAN